MLALQAMFSFLRKMLQPGRRIIDTLQSNLDLAEITGVMEVLAIAEFLLLTSKSIRRRLDCFQLFAPDYSVSWRMSKL